MPGSQTDAAHQAGTPADELPTPDGGRILVCDDSPAILDFLRTSLTSFGFAVDAVSSGAAAIESSRTFRPDVIVLDIMMPKMDGLETLRHLRADGCDAPVLFLTAKDAVTDRVAGLNLGGDDYVTKPFSIRELVVRLQVLLRRGGSHTPPAEDNRHSFADIVLDDDRHEVFKAEELIQLTPTEYRILRLFLVNPGVVLSKSKILYHVWNDDSGDATVVETYISNLRRKIDSGPTKYLHTLRGVGYVLREPR